MSVFNPDDDHAAFADAHAKFLSASQDRRDRIIRAIEVFAVDELLPIAVEAGIEVAPLAPGGAVAALALELFQKYGLPAIQKKLAASPPK